MTQVNEKPPHTTLFIIGAVAVFLLIGLVNIGPDASGSVSPHPGLLIGKCFSTRAGALGIAVSDDRISGEAYFLEFPSGVRAAYSLKDLTATDCPSTMRSPSQ